MGLFSSKKTSNNQTTNLEDNRLVTDANSLGNTGEGGVVAGMLGLSGGSTATLLDTSDNSFNLSASNSESYSLSDYSTSNTSDNRSWFDGRAWNDNSQRHTSINVTDGDIIKAAFDYLKVGDASRAKQVDALLDTSKSAVAAAMESNESAESLASKTMIYALAAVAAVLIFRAA